LNELPLYIKQQVWSLNNSIFINYINNLCNNIVILSDSNRLNDGHIKVLCDYIGTSEILFNTFANYCCHRLINDNQPLWGSLLRQVLMGTQEGINRIQSLGMLYELSWIIDNCKRHQKIEVQRLYDIIEKLKALVIVQAYQISKRLNRPMVTEKRLGNIDNVLKSGGTTNTKTSSSSSSIRDPSILKPIKGQQLKSKDHFNITSSDTILTKSLKGAINYITRMDDEKIFENRVDDSIAPGYSSFIKNPMEISTIKKKLSQYKSLDDLNNDIVIMFENCINYNGLDNYYGMKADEYLKKWNTKFNKEKGAISNNGNNETSILTLQQCLEESLKYVTSLDRNRFFSSKVTDEIAPGYSNEIRNPMDFGLIKRKLSNYNRFDSFDKDVLLVYNNCIQFNGIESVLGSIASDHKIKWLTKKENLMKRLVIDTTLPVEPLPTTTNEKLSKNKDYGDEATFQSNTNENQSVKSNLNEKKATTGKISFSKGLDEALNFLTAVDTNQVFSTRVTDDVAPGYSQIIKNPMDLSKMKKKLNRYSSLDEFDSDVILMFDNCTRYNGKGSEYSNLAIDLKAKWSKMKESLKNRINYELNDQAVIISSQGSGDAPKMKLVLTIKKDVPPPPAPKETKVLAAIPTMPIRNKDLPEATTTFSIQADMTKKQAIRSAIEFSWFYLVDLDDKGFFSCPVTDSIAPGYSRVIENPMDLSVIRVKIDRKAYKTLELFDNDVQLMLRNCFTYNNDMSQIYKVTLAFKDTWDAQLIAIKKVLGPHAAGNDSVSAAPASGPAKKRMKYGNIVEPVKMEVSESSAHNISEPLPLQTAVQPSIESNITITEVPMEVEPVPSSTETTEKESHVLKPSIVDHKKNNDKEAPKTAKIVINQTKVKENAQDPSAKKEDNKDKIELDDFLYHNSINAAKVIQNRSKPFERFPEVLTETKLMWAICMLRDSAVQNLFIERLGSHLASLEGKVIIQPGSKKSYRDFTLPNDDIASKLLLQMCQLSLSNDLNIHALDEELIRVYIPLIMLNVAQAKDDANENDEQIIVAEKSMQIVNTVLSNEGKLNNDKKKLLLVITKILLM